MIWKIIIFTITPFLALSQYKTIEGRIMTDDGEPAIFASISIHVADKLIAGSETDIDGYYSLRLIDTPKGTLTASYTGYSSQSTDFEFNDLDQLKISLTLSSGVMLHDIVVIDYKVPLIDQDNTSSSRMVTSEKIRSLPVKDIRNLEAQTTYCFSKEQSESAPIKSPAPIFTRGHVLRSISMINQSEINIGSVWTE